MPRVRRYEDHAVDLPQTTGARFVAADNRGGVGGALGAGLQQLGGALSRHADALALREEHRAREAEVMSARELQQLQDTVRSTRGFAAEQAMADAQQRVEAMRREVLTGAESSTMRNMLADVFNQRAEVARHEMEAHVEREKFASRLDLSLRRQALAQDDAIRAITPLGFQTNVRTALDEVDAQGNAQELRPEDTNELKRHVLSAIHYRRLEQLLAQDQEQALEYRERNAPEMLAADIALSVARFAEEPAEQPSAELPFDAEAESLANAISPLNGADALGEPRDFDQPRPILASYSPQSAQDAVKEAFDSAYPNANPPRGPRRPKTSTITAGSAMPPFPAPPPPPAGFKDGSRQYGSAGKPTEADVKYWQSLWRWGQWGKTAGLSNAARHLWHFLRNTGRPLTPDMEALIADGGVLTPAVRLYRSDVLAAAGAEIEKRRDGTGSLQITTPWALARSRTYDFGYAMASYSVSMTAVVGYAKMDDGRYRLTVSSVLNVFDRYNWDPAKSVAIMGKDKDKGRLHEVALAQEYEILGNKPLSTADFIYDPKAKKIYNLKTGALIPSK